MMRVRVLPAAGILTALSLLTACGQPGAGGNDPQNDASYFCEREVTATFDDPQSAEFGQWTGGIVSDDRYEFESTVSGDGQDFELTCTVTGEQGSFLLESYELTPAG